MLEALQFAHAHAPKFTFPAIKGGVADAVLAANLSDRLALVLLAQNTQYLGFAKATFFHKQQKIEKVGSYYFSLLLTGLLTGEAYKRYQTLTSTSITVSKPYHSQVRKRIAPLAQGLTV